MSPTNDVIGVFPYLRSSDAVEVKGITLFVTHKLNELPTGLQPAVAEISKMFRLPNGSPIPSMLCLVGKAANDADIDHDMQDPIVELQLLLSYLHTGIRGARELVLGSEHASLFIFRPDDRIPGLLVRPEDNETDEHKDQDHEGGTKRKPDFVRGYMARRNWERSFCLAADSLIYPESPHILRHGTQNLAHDLDQFARRPQNWALSRLLLANDGLSKQLRERIFVALYWYAASCRMCASDAEKLVFLAIALESLLHVREGEALKERFKDAILTILGAVPKLGEWVDQFYKQRSKIVHEGRPFGLHFIAGTRPIPKKGKRHGVAKEEPIPHGPLLGYGHQIFRMCLTTIASGRTLAVQSRLEDLLVSNTQRLTHIAEGLNSTNGTANERLAKVCRNVLDLQMVEALPGEALGYTVELNHLFGTVRVALEQFSNAKPKLSQEVDALLAKATQDASKLTVANVDRLENLRSELSQIEDKKGIGLDEEAILAVTSLLTFATSATIHMRVYWAEGNSGKRSEGPT